MTAINIAALIVETDAYMDLKLNTGSLPAMVLRLISRLYTAWRVMLKDPVARSIGQYSENRGEGLAQMRAELTLYFAAADGGMSFTAASDTLA